LKGAKGGWNKENIKGTHEEFLTNNGPAKSQKGQMSWAPRT